MSQGPDMDTLWQHAPARATDPITSHMAAEDLAVARLRELHRLVYAAFVLVGTRGLTDDELQEQLEEMGHGDRFRGASTASTRREELLAGECKRCRGTGSVLEHDIPAECARCWGTAPRAGARA